MIPSILIMIMTINTMIAWMVTTIPLWTQSDGAMMIVSLMAVQTIMGIGDYVEYYDSYDININTYLFLS